MAYEEITCPHCGKGHRSEAAVARCASKEERKAQRAEKKAEDRDRRIKNGKDEPPEEHIHRLKREGKNWDAVLGSLRKNYLPLEFETDWDLYTVVYIYAEGLHWGNCDTETIAMLLLEKHFCGDYITAHPMNFVHIPEATPIYQVTGNGERLEKSDGSSEEGNEESTGV